MLHLGGRALSATLVIAPVLALLLWLSGAVSPAAAAAAFVPLAFVVVLAGLLLARVAGVPDLPLAAAWALGAFATSLAVYALSWCFDWTAAPAFAVWAALVAAYALLRPAREPVAPPSASDLAGLALCAAATLVWSWDVAAAPARLARGEPFFAWVDFFIHGGVISLFGDPRAAGFGSMDLAGVPAPAYHYASYAMPAALAAALDLPGLPLATSAWLPLGLLTLFAGAYVLGAMLAGPPGGLAAVAVLALAPDPASYGLRNGLFGFRWNAIGNPGAAYAAGFCLLALALVVRWAAGGGRRALLAACALVAGTAMVRVHLFALAFPATLAAAALALPAVRRRLPLSVAAALAALTAFVLAFYALAPWAVPALASALDLLHGSSSWPNAYQGWYPALKEKHGAGLAAPLGLVLTLVAALGALVVLGPLSAWLARRARGPRPAGLAPAAFVATYLALFVAAPVAQHGDPTEFTHRPLVVLYAVLAVWTAACAVLALSPRTEAGARSAWRVLLAASVLGLVAVAPATRALGGEPGFSWGFRHYELRLQPGLAEAAAFLRANAQRGEVFVAQQIALDVATPIIALSGVPSWLARPHMNLVRGGVRERVTRQRFAAIAGIASDESAEAALQRLRELGIRWYVTVGEGPRWDSGGKRAAFRSGDAAVYSSR
jgi:hypothetical protein